MLTVRVEYAHGSINALRSNCQPGHHKYSNVPSTSGWTIVRHGGSGSPNVYLAEAGYFQMFFDGNMRWHLRARNYSSSSCPHLTHGQHSRGWATLMLRMETKPCTWLRCSGSSCWSGKQMTCNVIEALRDRLHLEDCDIPSTTPTVASRDVRYRRRGYEFTRSRRNTRSVIKYEQKRNKIVIEKNMLVFSIFIDCLKLSIFPIFPIFPIFIL